MPLTADIKILFACDEEGCTVTRWYGYDGLISLTPGERVRPWAVDLPVPDGWETDQDGKVRCQLHATKGGTLTEKPVVTPPAVGRKKA